MARPRTRASAGSSGRPGRSSGPTSRVSSRQSAPASRIRCRRRGVRRHPDDDGRLRRVRRRARARARAQARGAVVRPGLDAAAVGRDSRAGGGAGEPRRRMLINGAGEGRARSRSSWPRQPASMSPGSTTPESSTSCARSARSEVIDYRAEDFTRTGPYDLIIDLVARRSVFAYRRALAPGGTLPDRRRDDARAAAGGHDRCADRRTHRSASLGCWR